MFSLLSWLYGKASRVYAVFGSLYGSIRNAALNAYNWARNEAAKALSAARNYAWNLIQGVKGDIAQGVSDAKVAAGIVAQDAKKHADKQVDILRKEVSGNLASVKSEALTKIAQARKDASRWDDGVLAKAISKADDVLAKSRKEITLGETKTKNYIDGQTSDLRKDMAKSGLDKATAQFTLSQFLSNPVGTLLAWLFLVLLDFVFDLLATGLGTVKYTLPPSKTIPSFGSGGPVIIPPSLGVLPSGLSKPLARLSVSGFYFSNIHPGVDFGLSDGEVVFAVHAGIVEFTNVSEFGYGVQLAISGSPWWSRYAHLLSFLVNRGDRVQAGQPIAVGDTTGNSSGNHLHLELKFNGVFVDPLSVLPLG